MRPWSARRRIRDRDYQEARKAARRRAGGLCEARVAYDCKGRAEQVHHVNKRQGDDPHALKWLLAVCYPCHLWVTNSDSAARRLGLSVSRLGKVGDFTGGPS